MKKVVSLLFLFLFGLVLCSGLHAMAADTHSFPVYQEKSWHTFQKDEKHDGVNNAYNATNASDIIESYSSTCEIAGTPMTITGADVDGDGYVELAYGCANRGVIRAIRYGGSWWEGDAGTLVSWKEFPIPHGFASTTVTMSDVDARSGYGGLEMVFGTNNGYLTVLNSSFGEITSVYACDGAIYSAPSISDIDSDGKKDIIFSCTDGKVYKYSYWQGSLSFKGAASLGLPSLGTTMEASQTLVSHSGSKIVAVVGNKLFVLGPTLDVLASVSLDGSPDMDKSTPIAMDINSDGRLEVIVALGDDIYCFQYDEGTSTLEEKWNYSTSQGSGGIPQEIFTAKALTVNAMRYAARDIDVVPMRYPTGCALEPSRASVQTGGTQTFAATCYDAFGSLSCPALDWRANSASLGSMSPGHTSSSTHPESTFNAGSTPVSGWVEAKYNESLYCRATVDVFSIAEPDIIGTPLVVSTRGLLGGMEIVFADEDGNAYMIDSGGDLIWKRNHGVGGITASPVMSKNEIVFQGANGAFGVDFDGNLLWRDGSAKGSLTPSLIDVNGDGMLEAVAGNTANNDVVVYGDATPPAISSVTAKSVVMGGKATISVEASDGNSGIERVEATVKSTTIELSFDEDSGLWKGTLTAPSSVGRHTITVKAWDSAGNGPTINNGSSLLVYSPDNGDDEKDFHFDLEVGCAKEPINVTLTYHDKGVSGATLKLLYKDRSYWTNVGENETDSDGNATLMPPFEGDYELTAKRSGYRTETETFSIDCTFNPTPPENETYSVKWLPIEDRVFQPGQNNSFAAAVRNDGNKSAYNISLEVSSCPSGWSCGVTPAFVSSLGAGKTFEVEPWFVVPENENATEKHMLLKLVVGSAMDYASFKATVNVTEKNETDGWMEKAYDGIKEAKDEMDKAEAGGKNVTDARDRLIEAQDAYAEGDYKTAYLFAIEAKELAKNAGKNEGGYGDYGVLVGAGAVIVIVLAIAAYFVLSKKMGEGEKKPEEGEKMNIETEKVGGLGAGEEISGKGTELKEESEKGRGKLGGIEAAGISSGEREGVQTSLSEEKKESVEKEQEKWKRKRKRKRSP